MPHFQGFTQPTGDRTYSAQLQEWSDYYKMGLKWYKTTDSLPNGSRVNKRVPEIKGQVYDRFSASASDMKDAKNKSAGLAIGSGILATLQRQG
ncbi:hypothetical protein FRC12_022219 [Ceratobasidium sp. 428]|nr:hypothetical protein FRC12_022219 [Ceratobasidium sp. 428]